jgi:L-amino acid N-acyltransferase YncA
MQMQPTLRPATPADITAIAAVYRPAVLEGTASFELEPPDEQEMLRRLEAITDAGYPYFVAEFDGRVVGYAYASAYRTRPAYRFTVENSVYIAPDAQGKGIGRVLLAALIDTCTAQGYDRRHRRLRELRLHHPAPPRRLQVLRHDPFRRLQVRPLARFRRHGAAAGRGRRLRTRRTILRDRVRSPSPRRSPVAL